MTAAKKASPQRAIFFGAHPDDVELFALGTLLRLKSRGWEIGWVIATDGARSHGEPDSAMVERRDLEARRSAETCGATVKLLGLPDGELAFASSAAGALRDAFVEFSPDLCLTHHPQDYHPDHRAVSRYISEACQPTHQLLYAEPILGLGPLPDFLIDITPDFELKCKALACHVSQEPQAMIKALASWNGFRAMQALKPEVRKAEGFMVSSRNFSQTDPGNILPSGLVVRRFQSHA